jgi:serine/threonine protein kinase
MGQPAKLGRYELRQTLGRGAMGVVYEGFDPVLGRRVAIKTILPNAAMGDDVMRDYAMRFTREAKAAARLSHPNIVQVYDFGAENDISYLVMEFVEGTELARYFESGELFDLQDVTRLMTQLLEALELAHNAGIVHRDIKPANVMVDSEGQAKLADFGVARVSDGQDATQVGAMVGTPAYMSPEQVQGQPVDRRTDIFSAGVILYQFLTGQKPFQGGGAYTLARKIVHDDPVMPSELVASVSPAYDRVIRRALAKSVDERYQTAREFSQALNALMQGKARQAAHDDDSTRKISAADMPRAAAAATAPAPAPSQAESLASGLELEFWRSIKDSEEVDDFELYLTKFPSGVYAELAQRKVAKMKRASTAAAEEAANLKRQLEEEARARREAEVAAKHAAEEKAKLEAQAQAHRAAAAAAAKPAVAPVVQPSANSPAQVTPPAQPGKKASMAIPAVIGVLVVAGAAGAYFMMQPKAPVATTAPAVPAQPPVQTVVTPKPEPAPAVAQPAEPAQPSPVTKEPAKAAEKAVREVVKVAPPPPSAKAAASKASADQAAAKAAADLAAAKAVADLAAAKSAADQAAAQAAAAAEQRAAAAEQRAAAAAKAASDRAAAEKAEAEKVAAERAAADKANADRIAADREALAKRRAARARELEWTKGGPTGSKPRSKEEIERILRFEGFGF